MVIIGVHGRRTWSLLVSMEGEHSHYWCPWKENMVIIVVHGRRTWSLIGVHGRRTWSLLVSMEWKENMVIIGVHEGERGHNWCPWKNVVIIVVYGMAIISQWAPVLWWPLHFSCHFLKLYLIHIFFFFQGIFVLCDSCAFEDNQSNWVWRKTTNPAAFEGTRRSAQLSLEEQNIQHRCKWSSNGNGNRGLEQRCLGPYLCNGHHISVGSGLLCHCFFCSWYFL